MGFQANVLKVMIASPGDVTVEREVVTQELYRWNNANAVSRELMLQPVKWETHGSPQMGAHPQKILNEHLLLDPDNQILSVESSKPIIIKQLDFLISSEAYVTSMELGAQSGSKAAIPLDPKKIVELFNAPRPDKDRNDFAGPAALRLVFMTSGHRAEVVLPIVLRPTFVGSTQWVQLVGSANVHSD
jgi:hypothetical protein